MSREPGICNQRTEVPTSPQSESSYEKTWKSYAQITPYLRPTLYPKNCASKNRARSTGTSCAPSAPASSYRVQSPFGGNGSWSRNSETNPANAERRRPNYYWLLVVRQRALRGCGRARKSKEDFGLSSPNSLRGSHLQAKTMKEDLAESKQGAYPDP